eukprot:COSAG06_NODE_53597_length_299_cov_0.775000_1_plen_47_part_01
MARSERDGLVPRQRAIRTTWSAVGFGMLYARMVAALFWQTCVIRLWS